MPESHKQYVKNSSYQSLKLVGMAILLNNARYHLNFEEILVSGGSFKSECLGLAKELLCYSGVTLTPLNPKAWLRLLNHCSKSIKAFSIKSINILFFASQLKRFSYHCAS